MFNWQAFLDQHNIEYVTSGPNVAKDNVTIHCPYCGAEDSSYHMGVSLVGRGWACWRRPDHRGKNPTKLVAALLGCSYEQAARLTEDTTYLPNDFLGQVQAQLSAVVDESPEQQKLTLPPEFKPFGQLPSARPFVAYLQRRGFTAKQIARMTTRYGLRYCTRGPYKGRIIFPISMDGQLVSWTGRTIYPTEMLRYKSLTMTPEKAQLEGTPLGLEPTANCLLWYDDLMRSDADTIYLVEGPFDALKVSVLGRPHGIVATCLFTSHVSTRQVDLLHTLLPRFKRSYVLLDQGALVNALQTAATLSGLHIAVRYLPANIKDPGDLKYAAQLLSL